jgi:Kdo2-lipid IVA lauroyltransferase/acyltransferase
MIKIIKHFIEALFVYFSFVIAKLIGLKLSRILFSFIFRMVGPIIRSNNIVEKNLKIFSSEVSDFKKKEIISKMWSSYGMTFVEYIFLNKFKKKNSHIKIINEQVLDDIFTKKKPVIFVSGHFSNFEIMSMEISKKNIRLATIYRPLNNLFLNPFMEYLRKKYICKNQIKKGRRSMRKIIEYIENKNSIALMIDQRLSEGEKIKFFNKDAFTTTLPAQLALKYNLEIVPIFIQRQNNNLFEIEIFKPLNITKYNNKIEISKKLNQILEDMILKNPYQWIWTHDRWK